ncbi:cell division protein FtsK, partial [Streptomyces sp. ICN441]
MTDTSAGPHLQPVPPIDDDAPAVAPPVDNPALPDPKVRIEKRKPVLASWLTNRRDFAATARHSFANAGYATLYHGVRLPVYAGRLAFMSPRGACRFIATTNRWVWDREAAPLRSYAVQTEDIDEYMRLARLRAGRVRLRGLVTLVAAVFGVGFALYLYVLAPGFLYAFAASGVLLLGLGGQQPDAPVVGPAVLKTEVQKLTGSIVLRGLDSIGNAKVTAAIKKGGDMNGLRFVSEIVRDGPGYRADLDLPYGVTPEDIMEARKPLASGLRRKTGCVWPSPDPEQHEGRLVL